MNCNFSSGITGRLTPKSFTWEKCTRETYNVYVEAMDSIAIFNEAGRPPAP
jgi:hypothetical protein